MTETKEKRIATLFQIIVCCGLKCTHKRPNKHTNALRRPVISRFLIFINILMTRNTIYLQIKRLRVYFSSVTSSWRLKWSKETWNSKHAVSMIFDIAIKKKLIFMFAHSAQCSVTEQTKMNVWKNILNYFHLSLSLSSHPSFTWKAAVATECISKSKHYDTPTSTVQQPFHICY